VFRIVGPGKDMVQHKTDWPHEFVWQRCCKDTQFASFACLERSRDLSTRVVRNDDGGRQTITRRSSVGSDSFVSIDVSVRSRAHLAHCTHGSVTASRNSAMTASFLPLLDDANMPICESNLRSTNGFCLLSDGTLMICALFFFLKPTYLHNLAF
jgi:hypothetical protein